MWSTPSDVSLILEAEHTFNASTFACRKVVSTRGGMYAGVGPGMGTPSGSLHGRANARVMETVLQMTAEGISTETIANLKTFVYSKFYCDSTKRSKPHDTLKNKGIFSGKC
jgi:citrate synthase